MKKFLSPIRILIVLLHVLAISGSLSWGKLDPQFWLGQLFHFFILLISGGLTIFILKKLLPQLPWRQEHLIVTSLILFLLLNPDQAWWAFVTAGIVTQLIEKLLRIPTGPLFNPAAAGIVLLTFVKVYPIWWGASFAPRIPILSDGVSVAVLITLSVAGYVAYKYKKHLIALAGFLGFGVLYLLVFQANPLFIMLEGTLIFFLTVMAVEPKTTPVVKLDQFIFGVALAGLIVFFQKIYIAEPYASALLVVNLLFSLHRHRKWLKNKLFRNQVAVPSLDRNTSSLSASAPLSPTPVPTRTATPPVPQTPSS